MYLSNCYADFLFEGIKEYSKIFEFGVPKVGILSAILFSVLIHSLSVDVALEANDYIICYADDICIKSSSKE